MIRRNFIIILIVVVRAIVSYSQKSLPVENFIEYYPAKKSLQADGISYVEDINNVFEKYIGSWKSSNLEQNFEIKIEKFTEEPATIDNIKWDYLLLTYKLIEKNGSTITSTLGETNDSPYMIRSSYIDENGNQTFTFFGSKVGCDVDGEIVTEVSDADMNLYFYPTGENIDNEGCSELSFVFPEKPITLKKQ